MRACSAWWWRWRRAGFGGGASRAQPRSSFVVPAAPPRDSRPALLHAVSARRYQEHTSVPEYGVKQAGQEVVLELVVLGIPRSGGTKLAEFLVSEPDIVLAEVL